MLAALTLYAAVLFVSPVLHHDLACHLESPAHCVACQASPPAPRAERAAGVESIRLPLLGYVELRLPAAREDAERPSPLGRSPPA